MVVELAATGCSRISAQAGDRNFSVRPILHETASNEWRFGLSWSKACPPHFNPSDQSGCASSLQLRPIRFEAPFNVPAVNANQGLPSRDILIHKSAARPSPGGTQLRSADACADSRP